MWSALPLVHVAQRDAILSVKCDRCSMFVGLRPTETRAETLARILEVWR